MAEDLSQTTDVQVPPSEPDALVPLEPRRQERRPHRFRFGIAYLALAVLAGAGVGATVLLLDRPGKQPEAVWSSWRPVGRESTFPSQIADYVSGRYRLPSGNPLVGILAGPPKVQDVAVRAVAITSDPEGASDDVSIVPAESSVMYVLCGLGARCSLREGAQSEALQRLLRREALELALYTLKYGGVDSVIALLPPRRPPSGAAPDEEEISATALFFQRRDLRAALERPLRGTLLSTRPPQGVEISSLEGPTIDRLTTPHLFQYEFQQAQEGSAILILAPLAR